MNEAFDGPESQTWIEPFAAYLRDQRAVGKTDLDRALRLWTALDTRLGWLAVARGYMSARDVYSVLALAQDRDGLFGELCIELGVLSARQVADLLTLQHSPFRLFVHCLIICEMLDEPTVSDLLIQFADYEGLEPPWQVDAERLEDGAIRLLREGHVCKEWVWRKLDQLGTLAMIPEASIALLHTLEAAERSEGGLSAAATVELVQGDLALAAQLLRISGRTASGRASPAGCAASIEQAVELLGPATVHQLVLTPTALGQLDAASVETARELWQHSQRSALWCRALKEAIGGVEDPELHGLLHDIGHWVLLQAFPSECRRVKELATEDATFEQAERQVFGTTHADIGAYVCRHWGLPEPIGQAALHHGTPTVLLRELPDLLPTTRVVHAACRLAHAASAGQIEHLDATFLEFHGLTQLPLRQLAASIEAQLLTE